MQYIFKHFSELTLSELYALLAVRQAVFIVEQNCPYQDADGYDDKAHHLWIVLPSATDTTSIAAYLRIFAPGIKYAEASLGRIISTAQVRGTGMGRALVDEGIRRCQVLYPHAAIRIGAQMYLEAFYQSFGFTTVSDPYMEDGIPHIEMILEMSSSVTPLED